MKIAVVFDTPYEGWEDEDFREDMAGLDAREDPDYVEDAEYEVADALQVNGHDVLLVGVHADLHHVLESLKQFSPDLVFNCVEAFRDDPTHDYLVPALLEAEGYRFTGAPPLGLLTTRNKAMSKQVLAYHDIRVPGFATYRISESVAGDPGLAFPLIVKPLQEDASAGIAQASVVRDGSSLGERVSFVHSAFSQPAIAEEFVEGRELYVSMVGNGERLEILPMVEMVFDKRRTKPEERIATKSAKWNVAYRDRKGIRNVFARPIAHQVRERIEEICKTAYRALWLRDYARLDVRLTAAGNAWVIEANANPFIGYGHDMSNAAEKAGMDYYQFVQRIVDEAMGRYGC